MRINIELYVASFLIGTNLMGCFSESDSDPTCTKYTSMKFYYYTIIDNFGSPAEVLDSLVTRDIKQEQVGLEFCKDLRCTESRSAHEETKTPFGNTLTYKDTSYQYWCN